MKPEWILENMAVVRWRSWATIITVIVVAVTMLCVGLIYGREDGFEAAERRYTAELAEKDGELAGKEAEIEAKEAEIKANEKQIKRLERRMTPMTEDGIVAARMFEFYGYSPYDRSPAFETDAEFKEWCQENYSEAVFPSNEWTTEEVIASWGEKPEIWGCWKDGDYYYRGSYFCWTSDWNHCFMFDADGPMVDYDTGEHRELTSGWLVVDGVRVAMLDKETYDISDPYEMIRQYQAGEWDGSSRRSLDGSTTVEIDSYGEGLLRYDYGAWFYDETFDPEGMGWTGFVSRPWWFEDGVSEELLALSRYELTDMDWTEKNVCLRKSLSLRLYGDLPVGYEVSRDAVLDRGRGSTRYMDQTGIKLFQRGEALYEWNFAEFGFDCAFDGGKMALFAAFEDPTEGYAQDIFYLYDGRDRLVALRKDGSAAVVLSCLAYKDVSNGVFWGFQDGELTYWQLYERFANDMPTVVAEDVLEVDFTKLAMFRKEDGWYAVIRGSDSSFTALYLDETLGPEHYAQLCDDLTSAKYIVW